MNIEDRLAAELTVVADRLPAPVIEPPGLAAVGRRERTRRRSLLGGAAAAVLAAVTGSALLVVPTLDSEPEPTGPLEGRTEIPWTSDGVLHLPSRELDPPGEAFAKPYYANGTVLYYLEENGALELYLERPEGPLRLGQVSGDGISVQLSGNGRYVAWKQGDQDTAELVVWDLASEAELGRIDIESNVPLYSVDNTGRVYSASEDLLTPVVQWRPGSEPAALGLPDSQATQGVFWPGGFSVVDHLNDETATYGTIGPNGRFKPVGEVPSLFGRWSPDGSAYVYVADGDRVVVDHLDGSQVELDVPRRPAIDLVEWETPGLMVVEVPTDDGYTWMRCDATSGECAEVTDGPTEAAGMPNDYSFES